MIRWTTAFIDRPSAGFPAVRDFWLAVTSTALSSPRGDHDEFATLLPTTGDACLRVQRTRDESAGSHIDLHVDDVRSSAAVASGLGATVVDDNGTFVVMRSPGGLPFCVVAHHGESTTPGPVGEPGTRTIVDQVCLDIAPDRFDEECESWAGLTRRPLADGRDPEYRVLDRTSSSPLHFLLQRRGDDDRGHDTSCHLDLACDDVESATRAHVELGAHVVTKFPWWTVMADPAGAHYCLTARDPDTGLPSGRRVV